ncbi:FAD-dependent 5-carboxymethylaminomethyl-2-thiouridine(34) oxidoreductase MnmC [Sphaerotilus sp.]|uniref:FAD-dependent 5-carboxymethylaminomethyl-2-thiouridine(34) oxidoreductase MnmC n=1 Tax=Sphaerotilus sp. TaxID=2093942 RepID=UPI0034E2BAAB
MTASAQSFDLLAASGLPARWRHREHMVVLDLGTGASARLRTVWCADPLRCERLIVLALGGPDSVDFEDGRVQWMRVPGESADVETRLRGLQAQVDTFLLDTGIPLTPDLLRRLNRLAAPGATLVTPRTDPSVRNDLARHGFVADTAETGGTQARFAPRFTLPQPAAFRRRHPGPREALVIGAGLAGCAAAWALARQGWTATVLDRQTAPAQETSGNPGGLMHGTFNAPDSLHARWFRAASQLTARLARPAIASGAVAGDLRGFVRLEDRLEAEQAAAQLARVGLPDTYVRWVTAAEARGHTGLDVATGGWFYADAGWLSPGDWSRWLLAQAVSAGQARFQGHAEVTALRYSPSGASGDWQALDHRGQVLAQAPVVVLANAVAVDRLLEPHAPSLRLQAVRGQTTLLPGNTPGLCPPRMALSGQGYGLTLPDGRVLTGATSQAEDRDGTVRLADHQHNLARATRLGICLPGTAALETIEPEGRVGWRATTPDRLPMIGPPLDRTACDAARQSGRIRLDQLRHVPRCHGLFVCSGLGSRGITSATLGAQVLAAWITGSPFPVEAALRDALDPAR